MQPAETLLVVDAMVGQESVAVAQAFAEAAPVTGLCSPRSMVMPAVAPHFRSAR